MRTVLLLNENTQYAQNPPPLLVQLYKNDF